jgi:hypothetical protein
MVKVYVPRTKLKISYSIEGSTNEYILEQVRWLVQRALNDALEDTIIEVTDWIKQYVPKRSGDLQESLTSFLEKSIPPPISMDRFSDIRLVLGAGKEVDYVQYVDQMTNAQVQHFGTWLEHSGRRAYSKGKPVYLDDPQALGAFFDQMVTYGKERFRTNIDKAKYKLESNVIHLSGGR